MSLQLTPFLIVQKCAVSTVFTRNKYFQKALCNHVTLHYSPSTHWKSCCSLKSHVILPVLFLERRSLETAQILELSLFKKKWDSLLGWKLNFIFENISSYSVNLKIHKRLFVFHTVSVKTDSNESDVFCLDLGAVRCKGVRMYSHRCDFSPNSTGLSERAGCRRGSATYRWDHGQRTAVDWAKNESM